jgi:DNA-binding GntR family transcriptional regulator
MILENTLLPGQKLRQEELARQLGVSRTPLLKALHKLEAEFLVESRPRRGMYVRQLSDREMHELYEVREAIECLAIRLCCRNCGTAQVQELRKLWQPFEGKMRINVRQYQTADDRFHALLLDFAGNTVLKKTYRLSFLQEKVMQMGLMRPPEETLSEHLNMIEAISRRDETAAVRAMSEHLRNSKTHIGKKFGADAGESTG